MSLKTMKCHKCGKDFNYQSRQTYRKYCTRQCGSIATYNKGNANTLNKVWSHDKKIFDTAMEMYWSGLGGAEIARHFCIPVGTVYSWIHDFGRQRERLVPEVLPAAIRSANRLKNDSRWRRVPTKVLKSCVKMHL